MHDGIKFPCHPCDYQASEKASLIGHQKSVHDGIKYDCSKCNAQYTHRQSLRTHIKSAHEHVGDLPGLACSECEFIAKDIRVLNIHTTKMHIKQSEPDQFDVLSGFACTECDFIAKNMRALKIHSTKKHITKEEAIKKEEAL